MKLDLLLRCVAYGYMMEQLNADIAYLKNGLRDSVHIHSTFVVKNAKGMVQS